MWDTLGKESVWTLMECSVIVAISEKGVCKVRKKSMGKIWIPCERLWKKKHEIEVGQNRFFPSQNCTQTSSGIYTV